MRLKNLAWLLCLSLFFFLIGCTSNNQVPATTYQQLELKIARLRHAQIIQRGDFLRIVLHKDAFFEPNTTKLKPNRFVELVIIAELLKFTGRRTILITGHSDSVKSEKERWMESDIIARNIAGFLWAKGIPYERMQVYGLSDSKLVAEENTPFGSAYNRRVEIQVPFEAF